MWILLLITTTFLIPTTEVLVKVTPIYSYPTLQICEAERIRITAEFDKSYPPEERDYAFECKPVRRSQL
jgi:hypothetical protein